MEKELQALRLCSSEGYGMCTQCQRCPICWAKFDLRPCQPSLKVGKFIMISFLGMPVHFECL